MTDVVVPGGARLMLVRERASGEGTSDEVASGEGASGEGVGYRGTIELTPGEPIALRVTVRTCAGTPGGYAADAVVEPERALEVPGAVVALAAAIVRGAVRSAVVRGERVPRKIHRWRLV